MGARFLAPVLSFLDKTFRFVGGDQGLSEIENSLPIQRVLDVSRTAQMAATAQLGLNGGYLKVVKDHTHAGADSQRAIFTISANFFTSFAPSSWPHDLDCWMLDCWNGSTAALLAAGGSIALQRAQAPAVAAGLQCIFAQDAIVTVSDGAATANQHCGISVARVTFPIRLFDGDIIAMRNISTGAGTTHSILMLWVAPKGVLPPGQA